MAQSSDKSGVRTQLELFRSKLLDLTLRNRMLNFRPSKRLGVSAVKEDSIQVFRLLVEGGKRMGFSGKEDPASKRPNPTQEVDDYGDDVSLAAFKQDAEEEMAAYLHDPTVPRHQADRVLATEEPVAVLETKLRTIQREARLANEELGINTLFLTLGLLEWTEVGGRSFRAPLLFVPVQLSRLSNGTFKVEHDGSDVGSNLPLKMKVLEQNLKLPDFDDEKPIEAFFSEVHATVRNREGWQVLPDEVHLGFFNYEKFAMYMDLGGESWPGDSKPWLHPDIRALLGEGYPEAESPITPQTMIDSVRPVEQGREIYDADACQLLALERVGDQHSILIEGPPGTGKSQTISNLLAEAVADGKKVLFVAAKRAAVDVVKRRLEDAGLGPMCLDLHDKMTSRREFYAELKKTADTSVTVRQEEERVRRLAELQDRLNRHSSSVNEPLEPFGVSPFEAMGRLARLPKETPEDRDGRIAFDALKGFRADQILAFLSEIRALQSRIPTAHTPAQGPFFGCQIDYLDPMIRLDLESSLDAAINRMDIAQAALQNAAQALMVPVPATPEEVVVLKTCAELAQKAPPHDGADLSIASWKSEEAEVRQAIAYLEALRNAEADLSSQFQATVFDEDWSAWVAVFDQNAENFFRFLNSDYRSASRDLAARTLSGRLGGPGERRDWVRRVSAVQAGKRWLRDNDARLGGLFGAQWRGVDSDPNVLRTLLDWILGLHQEIANGEIPEGLLRFLSGNGSPEAVVQSNDSALKAVAAVQSYVDVAKQLKFPANNCTKERWSDLSERVGRWKGNLSDLPIAIAYESARKGVVDKGLASVAVLADRWPLAKDRLVDAYLRSYFTGVMRQAVQERPDLKAFEREGHESAIAEFRSLDDFKLQYNRAIVRLSHRRGVPTFGVAVGNLQLLRTQFELRKSHKPIRWILARAGEAVQRIKPVFMMSPLTVAIHLPPELPTFDLVVFDEASQIKPEDALSSIIRAKQIVVVGDTRQMPPTTFFDRIAGDEEEPEEDEAPDEAVELGQEARKLESILNLMSAMAQGEVRRPDLRWHYRSLHPSLIQPSNHAVYGDKLIVFPTPSPECDGVRVGILFHHLPDAVYEAGSRKRINPMEAKTVADAVVEHLRDNSQQSLMVAAMNQPQSELIWNMLEKERMANPDLFARFDKLHPNEPLAVKNLENVQGDERDVVVISMTYGRDDTGVVHQRFGPIGQDGGERRLNVLFTRARLRCEVFSSLLADDIRLEPGRAKPGLAFWKEYLHYAQTGNLSVANPTGGEAESPFEEEVAKVLRDQGFEVDLQVGTEGYRIDIAVRDPKSAGRYALGVECDGATYHSARAARDRDKLRQRVLERRGWTLHRIWSQDWWSDPEGETRRLIASATAAINGTPDEGQPAADPDPKAQPSVHIVEAEAPPIVASVLPPYQRSGPVPFGKDPIVHFVEHEGPIGHLLLLSRLREEQGVARAGKRLAQELEWRVQDATKRGLIRKFGDGYVVSDQQFHIVRDWSNVPVGEKKADHVTEMELAAAVRRIVEQAFGASPQEVAKAAYRLLGFSRVSAAATAKGERVVGRMLAEGGLSLENGLVVPRKV